MKMFYYFIDPWHVIDEQKIVHGCSTFNVVVPFYHIEVCKMSWQVALLNGIEATVQ